jgi:hypothetical protein
MEPYVTTIINASNKQFVSERLPKGVAKIWLHDENLIIEYDGNLLEIAVQDVPNSPEFKELIDKTTHFIYINGSYGFINNGFERLVKVITESANPPFGTMFPNHIRLIFDETETECFIPSFNRNRIHTVPPVIIVNKSIIGQSLFLIIGPQQLFDLSGIAAVGSIPELLIEGKV